MNIFFGIDWFLNIYWSIFFFASFLWLFLWLFFNPYKPLKQHLIENIIMLIFGGVAASVPLIPSLTWLDKPPIPMSIEEMGYEAFFLSLLAFMLLFILLICLWKDGASKKLSNTIRRLKLRRSPQMEEGC